MKATPEITIVGGGLAGSEAAWQVATRGGSVQLCEMRPFVKTGAHQTEYLAELICSNSLGSNKPDHASGLLKEELRMLGSLLIGCAENTSVPAGSALAVDRIKFAQLVTHKITSHPNIRIVREEVTQIPHTTTIIASGPLTSENLSKAILEMTGNENLFFFDAIAPIVTFESIDMKIAFRASRYDKGDEDSGDYINCPFSKEEYYAFHKALCQADRIQLRDFEQQLEKGTNTGTLKYFEGCLPIEILAQRGEMSLAFGPMRPVGLINPHTGQRPYAVVQLRQDNLAGDLYNIVGFQTNLTFKEQNRIFRLIPGLKNADFMRYGQMHRNSYISSPKLLLPTLQFHNRPDMFICGQLSGIEGYVGNIASGLVAGWNALRYTQGQSMLIFPKTTMIGALCHYITHADPPSFQPMKANFGILPPLILSTHINKRDRFRRYSQRAQEDLNQYIHHLS